MTEQEDTYWFRRDPRGKSPRRRRTDPMSHRHSHSGFRHAFGPLLLAAGTLLGIAGCRGRDPIDPATKVAELISEGSFDGEVLRIATWWPRSEQEKLENEFHNRTAVPGSNRPSGPVRFIWIEIAPGQSLERISARFQPPDVLLGGSVSEYVRLARAGLLGPLEGEGPPFWHVAGRQVIVMHGGIPEGAGRLAFDDPRIDPPTLTWAAGQLRKGSWREGYALLVRLFGHASHRPGWQSGSAKAAIDRVEADHTPWVIALPNSSKDGNPDPRSVPWDEGAAVCRGTRHVTLARGFLRFLADCRSATPGTETPELDPDVSDLLADLLGATLVDAQDELLAAWSIVDRSDPAMSSQARAWLTEPPPWPPASVEKLQDRGGDNALAMVQDLAAQIAPDPDLRLWLVQSWLRPRLIDESLLVELARAASGRLVREPRFRAWLRGEWTAWARQRYRRVIRLASGAVSTGGSALSQPSLP